MVEVEAAIARVFGGPAAGEAVAAAELDADAILAAGERHATPVVPLVEALRAQAGEHAGAVHVGTTSQDVLDTAAMLVASRARVTILASAREAADACAALAAEHRTTPIRARTLLQAALPTSFGLKAAVWMTGIDTAATMLARAELPIQLAGPVGHGDPALTEAVGAALGLPVRPVPWQADRTPIAHLAAALGTLAGALAKPCRDVVLLSQTEVAEVAKAEGGASSAMPHKRNPAAAVGALAAAHRTPALVSSLLAGMAGEHERAAGAWQAEQPVLSALLDATATTARLAARSLGGLRIDRVRMAATAGEAADLGSAEIYIDRALRAHQEAWA